MTRALIAAAPVILIASSCAALAQNQPSKVLGPTGTMYDGNNADLRLPTMPDRYWADLWAQPLSPPKVGSVPAGDAATTGQAGSPTAGRQR